MTLDEALIEACATVGISAPRHTAIGKWVRTDAIGKNGKGDGSVILDEERATAFNWQTGDKATVWLKIERTVEDKRRYAQQRRADRQHEIEKSQRAARIAEQIIAAAKPATHSYLVDKGFGSERPLVLDAETIARIGGDYLVPDGGTSAIIIPARIGNRIASVQMIWPGGAKKFLFGGDMGGATHRIATGTDTWLCEGYATGLSLRAALKGLNRRDTVLVAFSASNIAKVAVALRGRCWIAADHDAPPKAKPDQFGGLGAGEYFARKAERPYVMPPDQGMDFNDMHQTAGIFAVQRVIANLIRTTKM